MYLRPNELNDNVIDFGSFNQNYFNVTTGLNTTDHAIQYYVIGTGATFNNPPLLINQNGSNGTNYSVKKLDNIARAYNFRRPLNGPGLYSDNIKYFYKIVSYSPTDPLYSQPRPYLTQSNNYSYYIFQKAVAVVNINGTAILSNQLVNASVNTPLTIDGSSSRGYDQAYTILIYKRDTTLNWVQAVQNVDYSSVQNTGTPNSYTVTFNTNAEYRVVIQVIGYDSNTNPYGYVSDTRNIITDNSDSIVFKINTGVQANSDSITLPPIYPVINAEADSNNGFTNIYANKQFTISPNILFSSGVWKVNGTVIYPTNAQWLDELNNDCIVQLHITNTSNQDIMTPLNGLEPQNITIPVTGNYNFNYITTLR